MARDRSRSPPVHGKRGHLPVHGGRPLHPRILVNIKRMWRSELAAPYFSLDATPEERQRHAYWSLVIVAALSLGAFLTVQGDLGPLLIGLAVAAAAHCAQPPR